MKKIFVCGKNGRMANQIRLLCLEKGDWALAEGVESADVLVDFTAPEALRQNLQEGVCHARPLVIGTTGLSEEQMGEMRTAAQKIAIVYSPNMSQGVQVLLHLVSVAAPMLAKNFEIEISETHHIHKKDRPSGTAKAIGIVVEEATGKKPPIESIREGEEVGEHTIVFGSAFEHLAIFHRALDRKVFADGALKAAHWVLDKPAGLYTMGEVLGLVR